MTASHISREICGPIAGRYRRSSTAHSWRTCGPCASPATSCVHTSAGSDSRSAWNAASAALRTSFDGSRSDSNARVWVVIGVVWWLV